MDDAEDTAKPVGIQTVLAVLPSGTQTAPLTFDELGAYLRTHYHTDGEKDRNSRHALRDELFRDGGIRHMHTVIDKFFKDPTVRDLRKTVVPFAQFNNALKRIVNEMSTVYSEPALRIVPGDANNATYQGLLDEVCMNERMVEMSRMLNLHRALLVGFRVRRLPDGTREPVLDIISPASVRAVMHPNDPTLVIGWMVRNCHKTARAQTNAPAWTLWTDRESMYLRDDLSVIGDTYQEHSFGVCPFVPVTLGPPAPGFWPGCEGEDMVAGHITIWFENVLLIKESKSATKQTVLTGDGTAMGRGQPMDSENVAELSDGQSASTVDMSMDLDLFKSTADHVLNHLAQNYGMSPALITHQGVQSAEARELMRLPLREIRRQQQVPLRRFEEELAEVMSAVLAVDLPSLAFDATDWRMEFGESETPLDPSAQHELFLKRRTAGLTNTVDFLISQRPGMTEEEAIALIERNVLAEVERNRLMRPLMQINGSMGAATPDGPSAQDMNQGTQPETSDEGETEPVAPPDLKSIAQEVLNAN